jgi:competence protein ComEC
MVTTADISAIFGVLFPEPQSGVISGMLFGIKTSIPQSVYQDLITTGTVHIIALSGTNISFLLTCVGGICYGLFGRSRFSIIVSIVSIWLFVWFVGPSPSVVRAALMGTLSMGSVLVGRAYWGLWGWMVTCLCMLIFSPELISDVSFQLSSLSSLGILLFGVHAIAHIEPVDDPHRLSNRPFRTLHIEKIFHFFWMHIRDELRLTLSAQVFTLPVILWHFHELSCISPLTNILIGWTVGPIMVTGMISLALGSIHPVLGMIPGSMTYALVSYLLWVVRWTASFPLSHII